MWERKGFRGQDILALEPAARRALALRDLGNPDILAVSRKGRLVEPVEFTIAGDRLVGHLHVPTGKGPHPAVAVAGPMTSVKEQVTGVYAAALAQRGIAALAFDHRGYGESGGAPRQYEHAGRKIEDLGAALEFLSSRSDLDGGRLGLAGVCLGAGYAAHASLLNPRVRALGLVVGYYRDPPRLRESDPDGFDAKVAQGRDARLVYERTGEVITIPAVSMTGDAAMQTPYLFDYYGTPRAAVPNYANAFAVMSREHFLPFDVQAAAPQIQIPVCMVHSRNALSPDAAERFYANLPGSRSLTWLDGENQVAFYDGPELVSRAADILAEHLHREL